MGFVSLLAALGSSISSCFLTALGLPLLSMNLCDGGGEGAETGCSLAALPRGRGEGGEGDAETGVE